MKRYLIYFTFSCFLCFFAKAQTGFLQIVDAYITDSSGVNTITNLQQNSTVFYNVTIKNLSALGTITFNDTLALKAMANNNPNNIFTVYPQTVQLVTILPLDSVIVKFQDSVTSARYGGGGGGGTIVIWPIAKSGIFTSIDSFTLGYTYSSIESVLPAAPSLWSVYPNPTQKEIFIKNNESKNKIEYVRFFNSQAVLVKEKNSDCTEIDISDLPNGMYFLLIRDMSGKQAIYKVQVGK